MPADTNSWMPPAVKRPFSLPLLRTAIPIALLGFAALIGAYTWVSMTSGTEAIVERLALREASERITRLQGTLESFLVNGDRAQAQREVSVMSSFHCLDFVCVLDETDTVVYASQPDAVGRHASEILGSRGGEDWRVHAQRLEEVRATLRTTAETGADGRTALAYGPVLLAAEPGELRPSRVGALIVGEDISSLKGAARRFAAPEAAGTGLLVAGTAAILWWLLDRLVTRRARRVAPVTARSGAGEDALREMRAQLDEAERLARLGSWTWETGDRLSFSGNLLSLAGLAPQTGPGYEPLLEAVHPEDRARVDGDFREALESTQTMWELECRVVLPGGAVRRLRNIGTIMRDEGGKPIKVVGTAQDVTEQWLAEEKIHRSIAELEERVAQRTAELQAKSEELKTFSYSVSHDLKAPLRGIEGYSRLLVEEYKDKLGDEGRHFLANIREAARKMQELIDAHLAYSRFDRRTRSMTTLNLRELVGEILAERRHDLEGVNLTAEVDPDPIHADSEGLVLALRNLVDNAVKFSRHRRPPAIEIRSKREGDRCVLSIRDNGTGFDMKYHDQLFEIFQHLNRAEGDPGTGIGLALVKKAMDRMGGRVWAESQPNQGAVFYLDFPQGEKSVIRSI